MGSCASLGKKGFEIYHIGIRRRSQEVGPIFSNFFLWWQKKFFAKGHGRFGQGVNTPLNVTSYIANLKLLKLAQWESKCRFLGEKWMDVDHGYYLLLLGRALQKAHNENRDLPRNFILSTCFVYLLFLFSLFSFSPFLFFIFFQPWGGGGAISPSPLPQIRHWIYLAILFFLHIYCCWGGHFKKRTMRIEIYLTILFFLLVLFISFFLSFLFLLSSFPSFLFFFVSLWGGDLPHRPPPLRFATGFTSQFHSFYLFCLFTFPFFSLFFFSFPLFPLFYFFLSAFGGGGRSPLSPPPSDSPLDLPRNFILSTCFVYLLFLFLSFLFLLSSFPSFLFFLSAFGGGGRSPPSPPLRFATGFTSQFHSFYLFCLFTFPFSLFSFLLSSSPLFYFFCQPLGGAIAPIAPPSDPPLW